MQQDGASGRQPGHALLRALRHGDWSSRALCHLLAQTHVVYRYLIGVEDRWRPRWQVEVPISRLVPPMDHETLEALEACLLAMAGPTPLMVRPYTAALCETWEVLADGDPLRSFAVAAIGGYWLEPAWRGALREALWRQPDLYNGDSRFCWRPGGPEGRQRQQLWHGVMGLGPAIGRSARLAKLARWRWYDALLAAEGDRHVAPLHLPTVERWGEPVRERLR